MAVIWIESPNCPRCAAPLVAGRNCPCAPICAECEGPMELSWIDGITLECPRCINIKADSDFRAEMKRLEKANRTKRRR